MEAQERTPDGWEIISVKKQVIPVIKDVIAEGKEQDRVVDIVPIYLVQRKMWLDGIFQSSDTTKESRRS